MNFLKKWLGITSLQGDIQDLTLLIYRQNKRLDEVLQMRAMLMAHNTGLGCIVAKLYPRFGQDELSPKRQAESDKLGNDIMNKLLSEHIIAKQAGGDHS